MGHESHGISRPWDRNPWDSSPWDSKSQGKLGLGTDFARCPWDWDCKILLSHCFGTLWDNLGHPSHGILGSQGTVWDLCLMGFSFRCNKRRSGYKFGCFHKFIVFSEKFRNPWDSPWDASPKKSQAFQLSQARPMGHEFLGL